MWEASELYLSRKDLKIQCPALFATMPSGEVSGEYSFFPSINVVDDMERFGYYPVTARMSVFDWRRNRSRNYGRHLVSFRREDHLNPDLGDPDLIVPEITMMTGHDGHTALHFFGGMYRPFTGIGFIVSESLFAPLRVEHIRYSFANVRDMVRLFVDKFPDFLSMKRRYESIELTVEDIVEFAERALLIRWPAGTSFRAEDLVYRRRPEDMGNSLWKVFNVVHENMFRGGVRGYVRDCRGIMKLTRSKPLQNVRDYVNMSRRIWDLLMIYGEERLDAG